jgi:hypothetical protein
MIEPRGLPIADVDRLDRCLVEGAVCGAEAGF